MIIYSWIPISQSCLEYITRINRYHRGMPWPQAAKKALMDHGIFPNMSAFPVRYREILRRFGQQGAAKANWLPRPIRRMKPTHHPLQKPTHNSAGMDASTEETDWHAFLRDPKRTLEALNMQKQRHGDPDD